MNSTHYNSAKINSGKLFPSLEGLVMAANKFESLVSSLKRSLKAILLLIATLFTFSMHDVHAQLSGTLNIPGAYPDLASAIADLNVQGVDVGGVTLNLLAGNPQTAPAGGYVIGGTGSNILITGTFPSGSGSQITLQGNGNTITASAVLSAGNLNDAIFKLVGADWVTLTGFTMQENAANTVTAAATNNMTEWAVALLYVGPTDGSQNNTILGNTISLNRTYQNSFGIYSNVRHIDGPTSANVTTLADITNNTTAPNSNNKVYGNNISNVNLGIVFIGSLTGANMDDGNDIGGSSLVTGNNLTNYGGLGAATAYVGFPTTIVAGAYLNDQTNFNLSFNSLITSVNTATALRGILTDYAAVPVGSVTNNCNSNTVTFSQAGSGGLQAITSASTIGAISNVTQNLNNNNVINNAVTGASSAVTIFGVANLGAYGTVNLNNNIVSGNTSTATTGGFVGVTNQGAVVNTINILNNDIGTEAVNAVTFSVATTGGVTGISNTLGAATTTLNINGNFFRRFSMVSSGQLAMVINSGAAIGVAINMNNNHIGTPTADAYSYSAASAGNFFGLVNAAGAATASLSISGNDITRIVQTVTGSGGLNYINNQVFTGATAINNNTFTGLTANSTGTTVLISNNVSHAANTLHTCNFNSIVNGFNRISASGTLQFFITNSASPGTVTETSSNNNFSNVTVTGTSIIAGWQSSDGGTPVANVTNNTFTNITAGNGAVTVLNVGFSGNGTVTGNVINNISGGANVTGISSASGTQTFSGNSISNLTSSGASATVFGISITGGTTQTITNNSISALSCTGTTSPLVNGVSVSAGTTVNVFKNKISNLLQSGAISTTSPSINGILLSGGTTVNASNNLVGDLRAPSANLTDAIRGISATSTTALTTFNLNYNTVYIVAGSSGLNFGSTGIFHNTSATATSGTLNLRNNIIINKSTFNGTGRTVAYRLNAAQLGNYGAVSNNNLFYAGVPGPSNLIYFDGTNSQSTLVGYKAMTVGVALAPRDAASQTETNTPFITTIGSSPFFLHIDISASSVTESGAINIAGIVDDYDNDIRQGNGGYAGTGTAPDIGADEFEMLPACSGTPSVGTVSSSPSPICGGLSSTLTATGSTSSGVTYQWVSSTVAGGPYNVVPGATVLILSTGPLSVSTYYKLVVTCTSSTLSDSTAEVSVLVNPAPSVAVSPTSGSICSPGGALTLTASGGITYTWLPASGLTSTTGAVVSASPTSSTIYTVTGTNGNGCTATATASVTSLPTPVASVSPTSATVCDGQSVAITVTPSNLAFSFGAPPAASCFGSTNNGGTVGDEITLFQSTGMGFNYTNSVQTPSPGYLDRTVSTPAGNAVPGGTYSVTVNQQDGSDAFRIWIDANNNGSFDDPGEMIFTNPTPVLGNQTVSITIPASTTVGSHRLRIRNTYNPTNNVSLLTSCLTGNTYGVIIDFKLNVANPDYTWSPSTGVSNTASSNPSITPPIGTTVYTVTVTNPVSGCSGTATTSLTNLGTGDAPPVGTPGSRCGTGTVVLSATGTSTLRWYSVPTGGSILFTGSPFTTPSISTTTTYYVESFNGICPSPRTAVIATVNPLPIATATATPSTICAGSSSQLNTPDIVGLVGTGSLNNSTTTYPAPYGQFYTGTRTQMLILGTQLQALGFVAGNFTSLAFDVVSGTGNITVGSGASLQNFTIKMGITPLGNLSSGFQSGLLQVYTVPSYNSAAGLNQHVFNSPFFWDGSSNVIVETCYNNDNGLCPTPQTNYSSNAIHKLTAQAFTSTIWLNNDGNCNVCSGTSSGSSVNRPNMQLTQSVVGGYSWAPAGSLNNSTINNPIASPVSTTIYTVTVTGANGCTNTATAAVNVNPSPATPTINTSTTFCGCGQSTITATAIGGGTLRWYEVATGGTLLGTGSPFTTPVFCGSKTFYAAEFDAGTGCESAVRASVLITPTVAASISAGPDQLLCNGAGPATITATSAGNYTYTWTPSAGLNTTTGATVQALPGVSTTYIVTGTDVGLGCVNQDTVIIFVGQSPTVSALASPTLMCSGDSTQLNVVASVSGTTIGFNGNYATGSWTQQHIGGDAGTISTFNPTTLTMVSSNNGSGLTSDFDVLHAIVANGNVTFDWSYSTVDDPFYDYPMYFLNGVRTLVPGFDQFGSLTQSGSASIPVLAGDVFGFSMESFDNVFGSATNTITNAVFPGGLATITYSWSPGTGVSNVNIPNPKASPPAGSTVYTVTASNNGCTATATVNVSVTQTPPAPTCSNATVCGQGTANLSATGTGGTLYWTEGLGGPVVNTGPTYNPYVTSTKTYYVYEQPASLTQNVGLLATAPGTIAYASASFNYQTFNVLSSNGIRINTVDIVPAPTTPLGTPFAIQLENSSGVAMGAPVTGVTTTQGTVQTVTLNMFVPQGTGYRLRPGTNPNLQYHQSGFANPYTLPNQVSITGWDGGTTLYVFFYNWSVTTACFGPACISTATVNPAPPLTITPSGTTSFCNSGTVSLTAGGDPSWVNFSWSPSVGLNVTTGATVIATPAVTTTYTLLADDGIVGGCIDTETVVITINTGPTVSLSQAPFDTLCLGSSFLFNATAGSASFKQLGSDHNSVNNIAAIYNGGNANVRTQISYTAAQLNAAGLFGPGAITSIAWEVANKLSTGTYNGFTISMANVTNALGNPPLTATYDPEAMTTVFVGNVTTSLGWNTHVFNTPFNWNGVSNIIVNICNGNGPPFGFDQVYCTPTATAQTINITTLGCAATTGVTTLNRPNTRFTGGTVNFAWTPPVDLSSATVSNPVYTSTSTGNKTYTVTVTDPSNGCTSTASLGFVVSTTPKIPEVAFIGDSALCQSGIANMRAFGTTGTFQWQVSTNGINFINASCTGNNIVLPCDTFSSGTITATRYYRVFVSCGGDSSYSRILTVIVSNPQVASTLNDTICGVGQVCLKAYPNDPAYNINWFNAPTGGSPIAAGDTFCTTISSTTTYYAQASTPGSQLTPFAPLTTTFAGGNGFNGNMFDVTAINTVKVDSFAMFVTAGTGIGEVWYRPGSFVGFTNSNAGWTLAGGATFTSSGVGGPTGTILPIYVGVTIPAGQTYAFYVHADQGNTYTNGTAVGNTLAADANLIVKEGNGGGYFTVTNSPRNFNGRVFYSLNSGCSSSPRIAVTGVSTPPPPMKIAPTTTSICESTCTNLLVNATGQANYQTFTWTPATGLSATTGASVTACPVVTTTYIVTGFAANGCANSDTIVITVTPKPVITNFTQTPNPLCQGDSAQLTVTATPAIPATGNYTVSNIPFSPVAGSGTNVSLSDDQVSAALPIGFNFNFYGNTRTQFYISSNGFLSFNPAVLSNNSNGCCTGGVLPNGGLPDELIAFAWEDLNPVLGGTIQYFTTGSAPFRKLIVNFNGIFHYNQGNPGVDPVISQIVLNETFNTIEIHTTSMPGNPNTPGGWVGHTMGIENLNGTLATTVPGRNSNATWTATNEAVRFDLPVNSNLIYSWSPPTGLGNTNISNPKASPAITTTYTVTVTETATGCTNTASVTLVVSPKPSAYIFPDDTTLCSGSIINIVARDNGAYANGWPAGTQFDFGLGNSPDSTFQVNGPGQYMVTVTLPVALGSCQSISPFADIEYRDAPVLFVDTKNSNIDCEGLNTGYVSAQVFLGSPPYRFVYYKGNTVVRNIVTSLTEDTLFNAGVGEYCVIVTDTVTAVYPPPSCKSDSVCAVVFELPCISVDILNTPCTYLVNNITSTVAGGQLPLTYLWSNGKTTLFNFNVTAGTYTVTVTDANGYTSTTSATVNPPGPLTVVGTPVDLVCRGIATGSISLAVSGAVPPYTYLWNGGTTTQNRTGLGAGSYTVTVTDANGCTKKLTFAITQPATTMIINTAKTNIRCFGLNSGVATVTPSGGTAPYTYAWNTFPVETTATITGLYAGSYTCDVTDAIGCTKTTVIVITEPADIIIFQTQTNVTFPGGNNGTASVSVTGGTPGYTYSWNTVPVKTTASVTGLTAGTYKCTVTDTKSCIKKVTFVITEPIAKPPSDDSSDNWNVNEYPNPTSGVVMLTFDNDNMERFDVTLTDFTGRILYSKEGVAQVGMNEFMYDFTSYAKGVYFIRIATADKSKIIKIVIQ